jgi:phosphoenolpyruvate carboxylase
VAEIAQVLQGIDLEHASDLVRAFSTYFQAVNLAERVHRIRRRRDYERRDAAPQPGSLREVLRALARQGVTREELLALLPAPAHRTPCSPRIPPRPCAGRC